MDNVSWEGTDYFHLRNKASGAANRLSAERQSCWVKSRENEPNQQSRTLTSKQPWCHCPILAPFLHYSLFRTYNCWFSCSASRAKPLCSSLNILTKYSEAGQRSRLIIVSSRWSHAVVITGACLQCWNNRVKVIGRETHYRQTGWVNMERGNKNWESW